MSRQLINTEGFSCLPEKMETDQSIKYQIKDWILIHLQGKVII